MSPSFEAVPHVAKNEELVIRASRGQGLFAAIVSLFMVGAFAYATWRGATNGGPHVWLVYVLGAVFAAPFVALGVWSFGWWYRPPAMLLLAAEGLIQNPDGRRPRVLPWSQIRAFEIVHVSGRRLLAIEPRDTAAELRRLSCWTRFRMRLVRWYGHGRIQPVMAIPDGLEIELEKLAGMLAARTGAVQKE